MISAIALFTSLALSPIPAHGESRVSIGLGAYNNPPPALFGVEVTLRINPRVSFSLGADLLDIVSDYDLYGADLRVYLFNLGSSARAFLSGGTTFYNSPGYFAFLFHGSGGFDWHISRNFDLIGGLTYVIHTQDSYLTPRIAISYRL